MGDGILEDLRSDHRETAAMIEKIMETEGSSERNALFREMMEKLVAHLDAEQRVLYRKMEKSEDEKSRVFSFEGTNEHQLVEQQMQQMAKARNKADEKWTAQLTVLKELVEHHVEEEESTGHSLAKKEFDSDTLEKMREQFRREKEKLLTA
ncbi:MAG TPA: hemerythrin domain-containing protein [Stellaceae bacterium]|nr:hemerythrin domain-containing protein [Stellaceae bacterium]